MGKKPKKGSWIVRMERTVVTNVVCDNCTEEQARNDPFDYSSEETEVYQVDYVVRSVTPNE